MGIKKILGITLVWQVPISILWYCGYLSILHASLISAITTFIYLFIQAIRYDLIFTEVTVKEVTIPPLIYYCKQLQCDAGTSRDKFIATIDKKARQILSRSGTLMTLYFDHPFNSADHSKERSAVGYAFKKSDPEAEEILKDLGCEMHKFTECTAVSVPFRVIDDFSYLAAAIKTMNPVWNRAYELVPELKLDYREDLPMLEWHKENRLKYLVLTGKSRLQYKISKYPRPPWVKRAINEYEQLKQEFGDNHKKDQ